MNNLLKKFLGFSIGPVIGAFISFITVPVTTYFISPTEFGKASMYLLYQTLIVTFLYLGIDQAYTREYHESDKKVNLIKNALLLPLILSLLIFILIIFNLHTVSNLLFESPKYRFAVLLFGINLIFIVIERFILLSIRMEEKALEYSIVNIVLKLSSLVFTLIFVFIIKRDFLIVVYSSAFGQIITDMYLIIRYRKFLRFNKFYVDKILIIKLLKFGGPLIVATSLSSLLNSIDRIALRTWSSFYEIGIFTAALKISNTLTIVQNSFASFWVPTAYRWYSQGKDMKHFELVSNTVLLVLSSIFCIVLLFKKVIVLLLSNDYTEAKFIIGFLCLYPIMYTLSETTTLGIVFSRKSYYNIIVSLISIIPNIILNYTLVPKFGAVGAAAATGVSFILFFLGRSFFSNKNWPGFSIKSHILISSILFIAALINTQNITHITLMNLGIFLLIIILQIPTIKKIISIYNKQDNKEWDFS